MQGRVWIALSHTVGPAGLTVCEPVYRDPTQKDKISKAYPEGVSEVSRYPCLDLSYVKGSPGPPPKEKTGWTSPMGGVLPSGSKSKPSPTKFLV